ncbi:MAG: glycosyltransferase [Ktedonobacteraceae bacterium]
MNILMVSPHLPSPSWGAGTRSYYVMKALARNHNVSLLALTDRRKTETDDRLFEGVKLKQFRQVILSSTVQRKRGQQLMSIVQGRSYLLDSYMRDEVQREIDALLSQDQYDVVIFESVFMAGYRLPEGIAAVVDQHNIEYELLQRTYEREKIGSRKLYNWWESRQLKSVELERCRNAQGLLVTSERESLLLKRLLPECIIEVVPNGVDLDIFCDSDWQQHANNLIVFTGTMNYYPNIDGVLFFARECWPLIRAQVPDARWQIVGKFPPPEVQHLAELPGVSVTGAVPDVKPYLASATVAIAPLLIGSGTRLKILEALAMHKAVVSTSLGCEGLAVVSGKHLLVADQPQEFARSIVDIMRHAEKRIALGTAGRKLVEAEYSWQQCSDKAIYALEKIMG